MFESTLILQSPKPILKNYKTYISIALFKLYKLKEKLARSSSPYSWKKKKTKKVWFKKYPIFVLGPKVCVRCTFLQKTESANRKRLISWSRISIYSISNTTVEKQYECDCGRWKSQNRRKSTIFPRSLLSNERGKMVELRRFDDFHLPRSRSYCFSTVALLML